MVHSNANFPVPTTPRTPATTTTTTTNPVDREVRLTALVDRFKRDLGAIGLSLCELVLSSQLAPVPPQVVIYDGSPTKKRPRDTDSSDLVQPPDTVNTATPTASSAVNPPLSNTTTTLPPITRPRVQPPAAPPPSEPQFLSPSAPVSKPQIHPQSLPSVPPQPQPPLPPSTITPASSQQAIVTTTTTQQRPSQPLTATATATAPTPGPPGYHPYFQGAPPYYHVPLGHPTAQFPIPHPTQNVYWATVMNGNAAAAAAAAAAAGVTPQTQQLPTQSIPPGVGVLPSGSPRSATIGAPITSTTTIPQTPTRRTSTGALGAVSLVSGPVSGGGGGGGGLSDGVSNSAPSGTADVAHASVGSAGPSRTGITKKPATLQCPRCPATFNQKSNLNKHIRTVHENRRPFICGECGVSFGHKNLLIEHESTAHRGERPFKCDECGVTFGRRSNKYQHVQMVHVKRKNFKCPLPNCNLTFGLKGNLTKHIRLVHAKLRPFPCDLCDSAFGLKSDLKRHRASVHRGAPEVTAIPTATATATARATPSATASTAAANNPNTLNTTASASPTPLPQPPPTLSRTTSNPEISRRVIDNRTNNTNSTHLASSSSNIHLPSNQH